MTFDVTGRNYVFGQYATIKAFHIADSAAGQSLTLYPVVDAQSGFALLSLAGPANAFVTNTDYTNLHPGPVFAAGSHASFSIRDEVGADIQLTNVQVDNVPEPEGSALLIFGYSLVGMVSRARRKLY